MFLHVQYGNEKYDWVNSRTIDELIRLKRIRMFYRFSERRWINVERDLVRSAGSGTYAGIKRRTSDSASG